MILRFISKLFDGIFFLNLEAWTTLNAPIDTKPRENTLKKVLFGWEIPRIRLWKIQMLNDQSHQWKIGFRSKNQSVIKFL